MESFKYYIITLFFALQILHHPNGSLIQAAPSSSGIFREYIGAMFKDVRLSDVPINPDVEFHFILSFAIDYNTSPSPLPTNGKFNVFWDTNNLTPSRVASIKTNHRNVKVALSIGGATVEGKDVVFRPKTTASWVSQAVSSLTSIIKEYHLDGIDIDYEQFKSDPTTFAECIGQLVSTLKRNKVIKFASIASFDDNEVQRHYMALWRKYGHLIDYVNFQFYAYDKGTSVSQFIDHFHAQSSNYNGCRILASFASDGSGGLSAAGGGFIDACRRLKRQNKLHGIFGWSADDSKAYGFRFEKQSQALLAAK